MVGSNAFVVFVVTKLLLLLLLPSVVSGALLSKDEKAAMLAEHNQKRCMAGVPALVWDDDLAKAASSWADTKPGGEHSKARGAFKKYGECIQGACPDDDPAKAMKFWYDSELPTYTGQFTATHYTQVVWKGTKKVGCGKGPSTNLCDGGKIYVCQYLPLGNQYGKYDDNVIAPTKKKDQCPLGGDHNAAPASNGGDHKATPVMTDEGCQCKQDCGEHGESYTWCYTTDSCKDNWDYCKKPKPSRLNDENAVPNIAASIPNMALAALAMFACALLMVGAVVVARRRAKLANRCIVRIEAMEEREGPTMLE